MITSIQNELIKETIKLKQKKYRLERNLFLVEGYHMVEEAFHLGLIQTIFYVQDCPYPFPNQVQVTSDVMKKLSDVETPQGIIAVCEKPRTNKDSKRVLLLDHIQDPGNLGTLFRSAVAFGFHTVILDECVDPFNPKVIRATQGALFKLQIEESSISSFISNHPNWTIIGTDLKTDVTLENYHELPTLLALVLGNEGNGVDPSILAKTTQNIKITMQNTESLNVSVAGSILMHHFQIKEN